MDETSIYLDCPFKNTYATKGSKRVKVNTQSGEMARISAAFTASADGTKLPILVNIASKFFATRQCTHYLQNSSNF
ncbi:unnamed protein product [Brachionus calyciflorus]|uniref:DDE-1 domain-containing protein n=1 Tax=Brachionus calyciflorus TaxID=104777 RepID=A0A813PQN1_9BILA|nr:unnamed protein product [Brachionus calyciflorus]